MRYAAHPLLRDVVKKMGGMDIEYQEYYRTIFSADYVPIYLTLYMRWLK